MRNVALVAALGIAASLAAACSDGGGMGTLLNGNGVDPNNGFADGGVVPPGTEAGGGGGGSDSGSTNPGSDGGTSSGKDSGTTPPPPPPPPGAGMPCNVAAVLASKCVSCHSDPPVNGSLSGLVTLADLMAVSKEDPSKNEAQLSLQRMQGTPSPMPPTAVNNPATAAEIAAFQNWINGNYQGSCGDAAAPPPAVNVFTGAPPFTAGGSGGETSHNAGQNCMGGCHNHGFTFAGTLTDGNGNGVGGAEVRLLDANNVAISVHTEANGNFHSSSAWTAPAHVGARNATNTNVMVTALGAANGGCNGCHATGGTVAKIHLP